MHNVNSPESRPEAQAESHVASKAVNEVGRQTPEDGINICKSFEEDEECSFRSDDLSRSDALSDDFQTPSASLQNLLAIPQESEENEHDDNKIRSEVDSEAANNVQAQVRETNRTTTETENERKQQPSSLPLLEIPEPKTDSINQHPQTSSLHCQTDAIAPSPVGSASSVSPCNSNISMISDFTQSTESNISRESNSSSISSGNNSTNNAKNKDKDALILQPGTYNSKPGRKKMWYHVFTPSYKTRSADFRKYFKDLPPEERLIVDYSCAIQKEILVQGRMYISQNYVSFYANIFGWQTTINIKFKDILTVTKENTALVIPNAVQLTTSTDKYFFASFVNRDSTYMMLFKLWQTALLDQSMPPKEIWKLVHVCYGEVEIDSEENEESTEDYISVSSGVSSVSVPSVSTLLAVSDGGDQAKSSIQESPGDVEFQSGLDPIPIPVLVPPVIGNLAAILNGGGAVGLVNGGGNIELVATDLSDSSDSEEEHVVDEDPSAVPLPICSAPHDDGKTVVDSIIPCDVNSLFTMLFTSSKFYLEFHTIRKTFDILPQEWQEKDGKTTRQVSFTVTLNQRMGPKHSQITETQVLLPESKPGYFYAVDVESNNAGIPYADAFYVTCHFCLSRVASNQSRLIIVAQVRYRKSIWGLTKSFIEKNSWAGIDEFYSSLERSLKEECTTMAIAVSPPPSPRGKAQVRRRPLRKKGPAPGIPIVAQTHSDDDVNLPVTSIIGDSRIGPIETSFFSFDNSAVLKVILTVLASLLILNAFLYVKLTSLEASASSHIFFTTPPAITTEMPLNHQEWLELLQKQEALHRFELQKWHDILLSALRILKQAETDLESLKHHVDTYSQNWIRDTYERKHDNSKESVKSVSDEDSKTSESPKLSAGDTVKLEL